MITVIRFVLGDLYVRGACLCVEMLPPFPWNFRWSSQILQHLLWWWWWLLFFFSLIRVQFPTDTVELGICNTMQKTRAKKRPFRKMKQTLKLLFVAFYFICLLLFLFCFGGDGTFCRTNGIMRVSTKFAQLFTLEPGNFVHICDVY